MGKLADNIIEYICFAGTFTGSLILFAILIKHLPNAFEKRIGNNTNQRNKQSTVSKLNSNSYSSKNRFNYFWKHLILIIFIWGTIFGISLYFSSSNSTFLREAERKQDSIINVQKLQLEKSEKKILELQNEMKENAAGLGIGQTGSGGSFGMAALEGYAAALEVRFLAPLLIMCLRTYGTRCSINSIRCNF